MRAVILGAGTVGTWIADLLCRNRHSVTLIDADPDHVRKINAELDVRAIHGSASQSTVLFQADVAGCDVCLAVTGSDEVNIVGASMAKALGARRSVARVYAPAFQDLSTFDYQTHFGIDRLLSLEHLTAIELARSIRNPSAIPLEPFARGQLEVYEMTVQPGADAAGNILRDIKLPAGARIGSISRDGHTEIASGENRIEAGMRVSLIGNPQCVYEARQKFAGGRPRAPGKRVMIAGGGETGFHLAQMLSRGTPHHVLLLEQNPIRCEQLAKSLPNVTLVNASANRRSVLEDEGVVNADVFVACTGDDENNIMAGVEAHELGAKTVMIVVGRPDYANVVHKLGIDRAVSKRDAMARQIMGLMNEGAVISRRDLPEGGIGVFEIDVQRESPVTQSTIAELGFAGRCLVAATMRHAFVRVPTASDRLKPGDIVVALIDLQHLDHVLSQFEGSE